ncbi:FAD-dependent oxidoreductase [Sulfurovum sp. NBC37-1]|uniref:FAD-dependent oxidoreductase n=1 Tax=Sulfurovum sp. (strain NBC37-1) TaxID=387093 RepID=UPI000158789F|nr:FAD-dependent oxidoreductase [Sulfurovum sp. NBC37-1]BAF71392.1 malate:quinone oxidoreductase [Sulfurovum sp. NBC37-1]
MNNNHYEVLIVGAGISGAALAYELARYTDVKSIAVLEKYEKVAPLNSQGKANSQTIHFGDIETNYTVSKASITKKTAKMVEKYCLQHKLENEVIFSHQKMALGVGDREVEFMLERYEEFKDLFPNLQVWDKEHLKTIEPKLVFDENGKERSETIVGIGSQGEWTTVDYGKMTQNLIDNAKKEPDTEVDLFLNTQVKNITKLPDGGYEVETGNETFTADSVVVNAGAHSLFLAHKMGYGLDFATLPMAGSFYMTNQKMLSGKVYMVQNPKLPFAALHGDPDILEHGLTRFGPTALVLPKLERFKPGTYMDFWKTLNFDTNIVTIFYDLLKDSDIRDYIFRNFLFEVPYFNKKLFVKDARKIVPSLSVDDIHYAEGFGGVRPQVLNKKERKLMLGEASINTGEGIIFNMTPSPGATSCLGNAKRDVINLCNFLGKTFNKEMFEHELVEENLTQSQIDQKLQAEYVSQIRAEIHEHEEKYFQNLNDGHELPSYWDKPYSPWRNRRDHWSF